MTQPSLSRTRRIRLRITDYYQQYVIPRVVSNHRLWVEGYEGEAVKVQPVINRGIPQYYRITFHDQTTATVPREHMCEVEILPGTLTNR